MATLHLTAARSAEAWRTALAGLLVLCAARAIVAGDFYLALDGNDDWSGRIPAVNADGGDGPFRSLRRARDAVREARRADPSERPFVIELRGGRYELDEPLTLGREDAGTKDRPLVLRPYQDESVTLSGGRRITGFRRPDSASLPNRLPEPARDNVVVADLVEEGFTDFGEVAAPGSRLELFFGDEPMTLARWPNEGFVRIKEVEVGEPFTVHGISGDRVGKFVADSDRVGRWLEEPDAWLHGYWFWDWSDAYQRVAAIDPDRNLIELEAPYHGYGYRPGQRFYGVNLLAELDRPGEWYLDRENGRLYFWPPSAVEQSAAVLSALPTVLALHDAAWVRIAGITIDATRATAIVIEGGEDCRIEDCRIRNTGGWAIRVAGGRRHTVVGCEIDGIAEGGISLDGGDRRTLTPAGHLAAHNRIHRFGRVYRTYRPAIGIGGVGIRVAHNLLYDGPHNAIQLSGNDHAIDFNEIHHVCYETGDVGAFYMGRDWTARGTVIRYNYFHDIQGPGLHGAMAVYLDDAASGITIFGNLFVRAGRAAFIGGGRDNRVENNIFIDCEPAVHVDARGLNWMRYHVEGDGTLPARLAAMPYRTPPWSERYPELLTLLEDEPGAPKNNRVVRNLRLGGKWLDLEAAARPFVHFEDNLTEGDLGFVDAEAGDYRLREDSPARALGFRPIPFDRIGPKRDGP